jgi:hypothetical protein
MLKLGDALALAEVMRPSAPEQVANWSEKGSGRGCSLGRRTALGGKVITLNDRGVEREQWRIVPG